MKIFLQWLSLVMFSVSVQAQPAHQPTPPKNLVIANKQWPGDFDAMLNRRMIRVAVPYSRSLYYNDMGRERGLSAELVRDFERWLNKKYAKKLGKRPLTVYLFPATRDKLISDVADGLADISIGNLTMTPDRQQEATERHADDGQANPPPLHARQVGERGAQILFGQDDSQIGTLSVFAPFHLDVREFFHDVL